MNSFFCFIGKELADKIEPLLNPLLTGDYEINKDKTIIKFKTIEIRDIRVAFAKIKNSTGFGADNISSYLLKIVLPFIEKSLGLMFNTSIQTSQFPDSWKVAKVTPIFQRRRKDWKVKLSANISLACHIQTFWKTCLWPAVSIYDREWSILS